MFCLINANYFSPVLMSRNNLFTYAKLHISTVNINDLAKHFVTFYTVFICSGDQN